jgi:hypothetical protein
MPPTGKGTFELGQLGFGAGNQLWAAGVSEVDPFLNERFIGKAVHSWVARPEN